jgi:hypothetical protein
MSQMFRECSYLESFAMLGGTLKMDLNYAQYPWMMKPMPIYPTYQWKRIMLKKLILTLKIEDPLEEFPEKFKDSPLEFFPDDLPFTKKMILMI